MITIQVLKVLHINFLPTSWYLEDKECCVGLGEAQQKLKEEKKL